MRDPVWLALAGFGGGLAGSVAGMASLVSYPALLAGGLAPVAANVSNAVAIVFGSVGSLSVSSIELRGQRAHARALAVFAFAGGACGALLLLLSPARAFTDAIPWLIGGASVMIVARPSSAPPGPSGRWAGRFLRAAVFVVSVYIGYFGAGGGLLLMALLLRTTGEPLARSNAMRIVLAGLANAVAAVGFVAFGPVDWSVVFPLAIGFLLGGRFGPLVVRRAPAGPLRVLIACAGLALAVHLGLDAYS
jgi:uncharacterized membrane protein YfcA